jgi:hypothetical protein
MRSALGKEVNMSALIARNEKVRAVGNMNVNARGDLVDSNNNVITSANKRVESNYSQTISENENFGIKPVIASYVDDTPQPTMTNEEFNKVVEELTEEERELFNEDDGEIEK